MHPGSEPRRSLGLATTTSVVVGNMVGSGVFLLPAALAAYGRYSLWGWGFSTAGALLLAWMFSDLARRMPRSGGPYAYTRAGLGDFAGFLVAWMYWISIAASVAAIAVAFVSYLVPFAPALAEHRGFGAGAALLTSWVLTGVNIWGVRAAGRLQLITVILKLSPLLVLAAAGSLYFAPKLITAGPQAASPFASINTCAALTMWAFVGLECATVPADRVKDPAKTIPRATLLGTIIAAVVYIACTTAVMGIVPAATLEHSNAPLAAAAQALWGGWAGDLIAAAAAVSCFGALNGWTLMAGQFAQAVARDQLFPSVFAREIHRGTPAIGLVLSGLIASALIAMNYSRGLVGTFDVIILIATFFTLVPYMMCAVAEALASGEQARPLRNALLASVAFVFALWAAAGTGQRSLYWGTLIMLAGLPVYAGQKWSRARQSAAGIASSNH
ncbi:MAG: amino acid permease [Steroidobacteraceae bacterium]